MNENHYLVPVQTQGISKDLAHTITIDDIDDAEDGFVIAKNKLLDVNAWHKISSAPGAIFMLTDSHGRPLRRKAHRGDHISIAQHGDGRGYEWGIIDAIEYDDYPDKDMEAMALHVRPVTPNNNEQANHQSGNDATTTLVVERRGKELSALYHARNGVHATDNSHEVVATHLPDMQWSGLIEGMLAA
jgi:hypothetical protein